MASQRDFYSRWLGAAQAAACEPQSGNVDYAIRHSRYDRIGAQPDLFARLRHSDLHAADAAALRKRTGPYASIIEASFRATPSEPSTFSLPRL
jgi:hypothetical protein